MATFGRSTRLREFGKLQRNEVIDLRSYRADDAGQEATTLDELPTGTKLLRGQYTITGFLNSGGFAITYHATDSLGRPVVIKECFPDVMCCRKGDRVAPRLPSYAEELKGLIGEFVKEAHSLAALKHKNIVHVHQVFEENATAYMAIDFIDGPDLLDIIEHTPERLTPDEIVRVTESALKAIAFVHDAGMLHRDISPDNILVDKSGEPVLIDFGAARKAVKTSNRVYSKIKFVKDGYSPQEFYIEGAEQGPWSDLYSLAATIYHAVRGQAPEDGQKRLSALAQKTPDPYQPLAGAIKGYPAGFLEAIDAAMSVTPQKRPQTAQAWLSRLSPAPARPVAAATAPAEPATAAEKPTKSLLPVTKESVRAAHRVEPTDRQPDKVAKLPALRQATRPAERPGFSETDVRARILNGSPATRAFASRASIVAAGLLATGVVVGAVVYVAIGTESAPPPAVIVTVPETAAVVPAPQVPAPLAVPDVAALPAWTDSGRAEAVAALSSPAAYLGPDLISRLSAKAAIAPPARPDFDLTAALPDSPPVVALPNVAEPGYSFSSAPETATLPSFAAFSPPAAGRAVPLAAVQPDPAVAIAIDATPPAAPVAETPVLPVLAQQITVSHWDVEMPFEETLVRVRNANTIEIASVSSGTDLSIAGEWIATGATIYTFNGETLFPDTPLAAHFLNALSIDPDGFARATVRFREPASGTIDRGLLAVPVVRSITLADGTELEARVQSLTWTVRVIATPETSDSALRTGDILVQELSTGTDIASHQDLAIAFDRLIAAGAETARFNVLRTGDLVQAEWALTREGPAE